MYCKIQSPDALIFEGEIKELRLPTQYGDKHITSIKEMEYYVVKPGIVIVDIIGSTKSTLISINKGKCFIRKEGIFLFVSGGSTKPTQSIDTLQSQLDELVKQEKNIRDTQPIEKIESFLLRKEKIKADIYLAQHLQS